MNSHYEEIDIDIINLDFDNPRIAKFIEQYGKDSITSEAISLALGGGTNDKNVTSYSSLKESIRSNAGIIHPIIVNKNENNEYIVIEGNTRVQIYKEFLLKKVPGNWSKIRSIVYDNLDEKDIHAIRLQSHLVGPRDWDPYSKAKYLNYLSNYRKLPMNQIVSFCGGKSNEVKKLIAAYTDMEESYRSSLDDDSEFDQRDFSKFVELQNTSVKEAIFIHKYTITDFSKWVMNGNIDTAMNVRKIPAVLKNKEAKEVFLKSNISNALKKIAVSETEEYSLTNVPYDALALELTKRIEKIELMETDRLKNDPRFGDKKNALLETYSWLGWIIDEIEGA